MEYFEVLLPSLLAGVWVTLKIFCLTIIGAIPIGIIVGLGLKSEFAPVRWLLNGYVWLMRGTPLLLQLIFVFYGLPIIHITFERYDAALFAFILNYAAYFAEIFRGGFQAIPTGQLEAAKVLHLNSWQTQTRIVLPQVFKNVLPPMGNEIINLIKDSSLVYVIGIGDLLRAGNIAAARDVTLIPYILVGIIYLLLTAITTLILRRLETYFSYYK
ncbi:amino acid ABC transporter permease [Periweissella beninensis]|uniref:Amino acid ABC transporter permease n=1 Tax=Periweissella beninensis TaxID=504936 RepID=A0ABT0VGG5_9LACO|nr:amino acid ABC transporter permease [Periweissella beninensis]MBM7543736.1 polar amino acid transport system permease protein [Periweissella beninensis]MCM2436715.1 amino acid ABC transporter permease [Periweissella beninensis]MCT4395681.1 amino acid ABC transporter permease [Periweissella beninensis]